MATSPGSAAARVVGWVVQGRTVKVDRRDALSEGWVVSIDTDPWKGRKNANLLEK
jgi:hypothetical protein